MDNRSGEIIKVSIHVVPSVGGGWGVKRRGAARAMKRFRTKDTAESWARSLSIREGARLVVHRLDGMIARGSRSKVSR